MSKTPITPAELVDALANHLDMGHELTIAGQEGCIEFAKAEGDRLVLTIADEAGHQHRFALVAAASNWQDATRDSSGPLLTT